MYTYIYIYLIYIKLKSSYKNCARKQAQREKDRGKGKREAERLSLRLRGTQDTFSVSPAILPAQIALWATIMGYCSEVSWIQIESKTRRERQRWLATCSIKCSRLFFPFFSSRRSAVLQRLRNRRRNVGIKGHHSSSCRSIERRVRCLCGNQRRPPCRVIANIRISRGKSRPPCVDRSPLENRNGDRDVSVSRWRCQSALSAYFVWNYSKIEKKKKKRLMCIPSLGRTRSPETLFSCLFH